MDNLFSENPLPNETDIIIVGAGHNGLTAANYLRKSGLDVLVLEASNFIGGMTATQNIMPAAPDYAINLGGLDATFIHATNIIEELQLAQHGYREVWTDPIWTCLQGEDIALAIWRDPRKTAAEIAVLNKDDAQAYLDLTATLDALVTIALPLIKSHSVHPGAGTIVKSIYKLAKHHRQLKPIAALLSSSCAEQIDSRFKHPMVRNAIASICAAFGTLTGDGSAVVLLALGWYLRFGASRPIGGTQSLSNALAKAYIANHGELRCNCPVRKILIEKNRAVGVELHNAQTVRARRGVLASCDPRTALLKLLPDGALPTAELAAAKQIPSFGNDLALFKVDLALTGKLSLTRFQKRRKDDINLLQTGLYMGTFDGALKADAAARLGKLPEGINLYAGVPSACDGSQAPEGCDTLWLYVHPTPLHPEPDWAHHKNAFADRAVATAAEYFDELTGIELARHVSDVDSISQRFNASNGCLWHVDLTLGRLGPLRPAKGLAGYLTPIEGYYLGGAGCHPLPGISGLPGKLASQEIIKNCSNRSFTNT